MREYSTLDLNKLYEDDTTGFIVEARFVRETVGGQPAGEKGLRAFIAHHLKLEGEAAEQAYHRIKGDEGVDITPPLGEIKEQEVYSLNRIRSNDFGPWLGDWMVKACFKAAATRLGMFMAKRGMKGDVSEMGRVQAYGHSAKGAPQEINLYDEEGNPATTFYQEFKGKVSTPQGANSIVTTAECAPAGSRFSFTFRYKTNNNVSEMDIARIVAAMQVIGLGSAKSMERGKFEVIRLMVEDEQEGKGKKEAEVKEVKPKKGKAEPVVETAQSSVLDGDHV